MISSYKPLDIFWGRTFPYPFLATTFLVLALIRLFYLLASVYSLEVWRSYRIFLSS